MLTDLLQPQVLVKQMVNAGNMEMYSYQLLRDRELPFTSYIFISENLG